jgi:hypothetical protein
MQATQARLVRGTLTTPYQRTLKKTYCRPTSAYLPDPGDDEPKYSGRRLRCCRGGWYQTKPYGQTTMSVIFLINLQQIR